MGFADGRSESVGESLCRVRMAEAGLPAPDPQFVLQVRGFGDVRVDFLLVAQRTIVEFDGRLKYGVREGADPDQAGLVSGRRRRVRMLFGIWVTRSYG